MTAGSTPITAITSKLILDALRMRKFEELVFFELWIPDSGSGVRFLVFGFRSPGFRVALASECQE